MIQTGGGTPEFLAIEAQTKATARKQVSEVKMSARKRGLWDLARVLCAGRPCGGSCSFLRGAAARFRENSLTRSGGFGDVQRLTHFSDHAQTIHEKRCAVNSVIYVWRDFLAVEALRWTPTAKRTYPCGLRRATPVHTAMMRSLATERRIVRPAGFQSREISPPNCPWTVARARTVPKPSASV